jgi:hypothetical protein
MILFQKDWKKYPNAIANYKTKNKSWVRYSGLLKTMGIKNHLFVLALHNPKLLDIDPHDPNLTQEEKDMVLEEVAENPWYFFREVVRIPAKGAVTPELYRANRGNIALFWTFFAGESPYLIQIRQTGKSLSSDLLYKGILSFWSMNTSITLITKDNKLRVDEVERLKAIENSLPPYLRMIEKHDLHSTDGITVKSLGNTFSIAIAQKSKEAARNLGRGITSTIFGIDEFGFLYNNYISVPAALAAGSAARDTARRNGQLAGTLFYTTAAYLDTDSGQYAYKFYEQAMRWTEKLFDVPNRQSLRAIVAKNNSGPTDCILIEMNHRQLGYTDEWLRKKIREAAAEGIAVDAEFLNKWSKGSSDSALDKKIIKILHKSAREPNYTDITEEGFLVQWYVSKERRGEYRNRSLVMGMDTSDALGGDDIGVYIRDVITGETIATMKVNNSSLTDFGLTIYKLLIEFKRMVLIIERRSSAMGILDQLAGLFRNDNINIFTRVYNTLINNKEENPEKYNDAIKYGKQKEFYIVHKKSFGFTTSGSGANSRDVLYSKAFYEATEMTAYKIRDRDLIDQLTKLEKKNGRIDHGYKAHDDLVIAFLLTWWFLKEAKTLEAYGINKTTVLTALTIHEDIREDVVKREQAKYIEDTIVQIDELLNKIPLEKNMIIKERLAIKVKLLKSRLDSETVRSLNIESRLEDAIKAQSPNKRSNRDMFNRPNNINRFLRIA